VAGRVPGPSEARESFVSPGACRCPAYAGESPQRGLQGHERGSRCWIGGRIFGTVRLTGGSWSLLSIVLTRKDRPSQRLMALASFRAHGATGGGSRVVPHKPSVIRFVFSRPAAAEPSFLRKSSASDRTLLRSQWPT